MRLGLFFRLHLKRDPASRASRFSLESNYRLSAGGHREAVIPVPIPNTEVKGLFAEGTAGLARGRVGRRRLFFVFTITRHDMLKLMLTLGVVLGMATAFAQSNKTTFRDAMGRNQGSATTDRYGKTTYRDSMGRTQGSASTDNYGRTTFRDAMGRNQGSASTDSYGKTTYRDSMGRTTGTSTTDSYGKITYRDAMGRVTGTSTKDSSGRVTYRDAMGRVVGSQR